MGMFENILYATDFSESPNMMPCIGVIGKTKKIHLLHVVNEDTYIDPRIIEPRMADAKSFLEEKLNVERNKGVEADVHIMEGVPSKEICSVAKKLDVSLVVTNYHSPEGPISSATVDMVKYCDRNVLVMTRMVSDIVDRSDETMETYCTNLFRKVICPAVGDVSARLNILRAIKEEASLGSVIFSGFSDVTMKDAETFVAKARSAGIDAEAILKKDTPRRSIISAAEAVDASMILLDARAELGLAITVLGASRFPMLILKSP
jgi:nucleotide-binding universal stress UspA family protein